MTFFLGILSLKILRVGCSPPGKAHLKLNFDTLFTHSALQKLVIDGCSMGTQTIKIEDCVCLEILCIQPVRDDDCPIKCVIACCPRLKVLALAGIDKVHIKECPLVATVRLDTTSFTMGEIMSLSLLHSLSFVAPNIVGHSHLESVLSFLPLLTMLDIGNFTSASRVLETGSTQ